MGVRLYGIVIIIMKLLCSGNNTSSRRAQSRGERTSVFILHYIILRSSRVHCNVFAVVILIIIITSA